MRKLVGMFVLTVVFVAVAQMTFAQPGGRQGGRQGGGQAPGGGMGMMGGGGGMAAFMSEEGRKDLGLSEQQVTDIREAFRPAGGGGQIQPPGRDATEAEREKFREDMEKRMGETIDKVEKVFTPEQLTKVRDRVFQAGGGYNGLTNNQFAQRALKLTDDQKKKIRDFQNEQMQEMRNATRPDFQNMTQEERQKFGEDMRARNEDNQKKMAEKIKGILTDDQKAQGEKMLGETPEYIKKAIEERAQRGAGQGRQGGNAGYRPDNSTWQPGQGGYNGGSRTRTGGNFPQGRNNN